ncbi:PA1571 family protein [Acinetobacter shaoyimingii]|uniref:Uncharacterized protein n=1 Tax=Acinetobacter shaoyimingii TaxID=2715164 RepID=A0A6G8RXH4_9GAMM|nr:PA1571 family protein [Acinetobacter shaoyimingii]NHB57674.1 hypothetical protein [Acinetobacter shaoyimingii]QIO06629.1 hypothetical protein G8E00_12055 [Acinetobacter shaoyimingii]
MNIGEQILTSGIKHVVDTQKKNACVMVNEHGQEVHITKAMVVTVCQQLLNQCRNVKN